MHSTLLVAALLAAALPAVTPANILILHPLYAGSHDLVLRSESANFSKPECLMPLWSALDV